MSPADEDHPQPALFKGNLKRYQLRGMNWLANLFDQSISGILADEMGLGKTVQSIAFLCHIAEKYSVLGSFLIISPASTLNNWQQEMERFVPSFKVVPYWGNPNERTVAKRGGGGEGGKCPGRQIQGAPNLEKSKFIKLCQKNFHGIYFTIKISGA